MFKVSKDLKMYDNIELTFGRWKGCKFYNTPITYQVWLMEQPWFKKLITTKTKTQ